MTKYNLDIEEATRPQCWLMSINQHQRAAFFILTGLTMVMSVK